jgi:CRP/FNR family transcriptional regulator, cyclic AMP receptor protein
MAGQNGSSNTPTALPHCIEGSGLFRDFSPQDLEQLHDWIQLRTFRAGHVFYRPGEAGEVIFVIKKGAAQLYRLSPDGQKFVFTYLPAGSFFGEMAFVGQGMHECFAEATEDSEVCIHRKMDVIRLLTEYPHFALRLVEAMGERLLQAEQHLADLALQGLTPRLAAFLLREAKDGVVNGLSHQDIGERLGVYRETTTYALNELKTAGMIEIGRRQIRILDAQRLMERSTNT